MPFIYHELEPNRWRDLTQLLGPNGAQDGCWCMWWRRPHGGKLWEAKKGRPNRDAMRRLVQNRKASGILAYQGDTPVGWCAFGPRLDFPRLETVKAFRRDDIDDVWSVNCFYIARGYRGQGVARGLLAAALKAMRRRGARTIEAYPVTTTGKGDRVQPAFAYTGPLSIFEQAGFQEIQRLAPTRPLLRRTLKPPHETDA